MEYAIYKHALYKLTKEIRPIVKKGITVKQFENVIVEITGIIIRIDDDSIKTVIYYQENSIAKTAGINEFLVYLVTNKTIEISNLIEAMAKWQRINH